MFGDADEMQAALSDLLPVDDELQLIDDSILADSSRRLSNPYDYFFGNDTAPDDDFTKNLEPASDVNVDTVVASLYFNLFVCAILMTSYEVLRRLLPSVYAPRRERYRALLAASSGGASQRVSQSDSSHEIRDDYEMPLTWVAPLFGVSWSKVRKVAGLDGYFFLRYIRMCLRITAVSAFWSAVILMPVFASGHNQATGWYHLSMVNIETGSWRIWVPCLFIYMFSCFCFFVMKQEFRHYMELRMDFLGRGAAKIDPQHHYSIMAENIPIELRSDRALYEYFSSLFPGKVHSAMVVLNIPDLESLVTRRLRIVRRLEKSIASYYSTGKRPTHIMGRSRMSICGIGLAPCDCNVNKEARFVSMHGPLPEKGTRVDSISYYTRELAESNQDVCIAQKLKREVAESGNVSFRAYNWLQKVANFAYDAAREIMEDSEQDNALISPQTSTDFGDSRIPQAEKMTSSYGSFVPLSTTAQKSCLSQLPEIRENESPIAHLDTLSSGESASYSDDRSEPLVLGEGDGQMGERDFVAPGGGKEKERSLLRRLAGRLGLDFGVAVLRYLNRQMDVVVESVVGSTMSSTGFVTFLDLASVTCAASTPLTNKPNVLRVLVAPEPRDINWKNAHIDRRVINGREQTTNVLLFFGVILWTFPLAAIQAFATAEQLARIPGMQWILTVNGGKLGAFINGYLPVVALLGLILLLPLLFQYIATNYERRKTTSGVQRSMLGRYYYYQLANIYVTVTAGSLWSALADILERPSNILELLGESLPTVVGYFIALLITKTLAGLPLVFLRVGALSRMVFLRTCFPEKKLTQRELDEVYRSENIQYGWEYPTQLLVIVICFTYACICPVILPFGAIFFMLAGVVYKKQLLFVYKPLYESGGSFFPDVCRRTLMGLVCGQLTFIGYTLIRGCHYEPLFLVPLPIVTVGVMRYFERHYAEPSKKLSMERAMESDRVADVRICREDGIPFESGVGVAQRRERFDKNSYRQPDLTDPPKEPLDYRAGEADPLTEEIKSEVRSMNRYAFMSDVVEEGTQGGPSGLST